MPKIIVTNTLADTIKMLRTQNKIKSKDLAHCLGRTPGYVSKLEKGEIKNIELDVVESIFLFILGDNYKNSEIWEQIYASLQLKYTKKEINEEIWFINFDTVYRYIPIPETIIEFINSKITSLNISRDMLLQRINANEELTNDEINDTHIKTNTWYPSPTGTGESIKINMEKDMLDNILDEHLSSCPYIFLYCILYYLLKIEKFGAIVSIHKCDSELIHHETTSILNSHKFYSIVQKINIMNKANSEEELKNSLSSFDNDNIKLISEILNNFKIASEFNIRITNERLSALLENLNKNLWFTLKIVSLNYHLLEELDTDQRKAFVKDIESLIRTYTDNQKSLKQTETY